MSEKKNIKTKAVKEEQTSQGIQNQITRVAKDAATKPQKGDRQEASKEVIRLSKVIYERLKKAEKKLEAYKKLSNT